MACKGPVVDLLLPTLDDSIAGTSGITEYAGSPPVTGGSYSAGCSRFRPNTCCQRSSDLSGQFPSETCTILVSLAAGVSSVRTSHLVFRRPLRSRCRYRAKGKLVDGSAIATPVDNSGLAGVNAHVEGARGRSRALRVIELALRFAVAINRHTPRVRG